jgi:hypothetical protein
MSHNSGGVIKLGEISISKSEKSPPNDDEGGVGGLNRTPHLVKPLVTVSMSFESCVTFVMNFNPNLDTPLKSNHKKMIHL